jgi:restriction endonuclease
MYTLTTDCVIRSDGARIPFDPLNADYAAYLKWVGEGNTPSTPAAPSIPEMILRAKAETRIQRQPIIDVLNDLQSSALAKSDQPMALVIETAKQALRDITQLNLTDCTTYEQMKVKTMARYAEIASASPALKAAFSEALK